jgi:hypothetical protein
MTTAPIERGRRERRVGDAEDRAAEDAEREDPGRTPQPPVGVGRQVDAEEQSRDEEQQHRLGHRGHRDQPHLAEEVGHRGHGGRPQPLEGAVIALGGDRQGHRLEAGEQDAGREHARQEEQPAVIPPWLRPCSNWAERSREEAEQQDREEEGEEHRLLLAEYILSSSRVRSQPEGQGFTTSPPW